MKSKTFQTTIVREGSMCFIPVPFDPKPVFGKIHAPVVVKLPRHTFRSTISSMGPDGACIPLRRSNREAAKLEGGETLRVTLQLDEEKRTVEPPRDLVKALRAVPGASDRWSEMSYTHQREHVEAIESAKKPETRARRIDAAVKMVSSRPEKSAKRTTRVDAAAGRERIGAAAGRTKRDVRS